MERAGAGRAARCSASKRPAPTTCSPWSPRESPSGSVRAPWSRSGSAVRFGDRVVPGDLPDPPGPPDRRLRRHRRGRAPPTEPAPTPCRLDLAGGSPGRHAVPVTGPLGRPFALPKEPVTCLLVGEAGAAAPLFPLAERLRERGCAVHMLLGAATEPQLFGALEARRATRGSRSRPPTAPSGSRAPWPTCPARTCSTRTRRGRRLRRRPARHPARGGAAAEHTAPGARRCCRRADAVRHRPLPTLRAAVVGEDGVARMARACAEGPVFRGDRVRWADLGTVPEGAR